MVNPITDAAAAAAAVFARKLLEEAASQAGRALSAAADRVVTWIRRRGAEDAETGAAITMVDADPADRPRIELLGRVLAARAAADPEVGRELQELVRQAPEAVTIRDQAQVGMILTASSIGGQGGQGIAGGGGGGPAIGAGQEDTAVPVATSFWHQAAQSRRWPAGAAAEGALFRSSAKMVLLS
jgi:hypothetical protein